jgi:hypothetical protein
MKDLGCYQLAFAILIMAVYSGCKKSPSNDNLVSFILAVDSLDKKELFANKRLEWRRARLIVRDFSKKNDLDTTASFISCIVEPSTKKCNSGSIRGSAFYFNVDSAEICRQLEKYTDLIESFGMIGFDGSINRARSIYFSFVNSDTLVFDFEKRDFPSSKAFEILDSNWVVLRSKKYITD